jgi:NAD(P)-dependent dehydrogenase (short-subunit alcohol dehydrogenase family)
MSIHVSPWEGRKVLVTGGTRGLGRALAESLDLLGAQVAVIGRQAASLQELHARHPRIHAIRGDLGRKEDIHPMALSAIDALGGLDVLIHNAGILGPKRLQLLADTDCEDFEAALQVHVLGPFRLTKALLGPLNESQGAVVHVTSDAAVSAYPYWGAYGASKAAMDHMARIWDAEMRSVGIRLLSVDPGDMHTDLHLQAIPDADTRALKSPLAAAAEVLARVARHMEVTS